MNNERLQMLNVNKWMLEKKCSFKGKYDMDDDLFELLKNAMEKERALLMALKEKDKNKFIKLYEEYENESLLNKKTQEEIKQVHINHQKGLIQSVMGFLGTENFPPSDALSYFEILQEIINPSAITLTFWLSNKEDNVKDFLVKYDVSLTAEYYDNFYELFKTHIYDAPHRSLHISKQDYMLEKREEFFTLYHILMLKTKLDNDLIEKSLNKKMKI